MNFLVTVVLISVGIFLYSVVAVIQIPCYFKWGYAKAKMITSVLPIIIGLGVPIIVITGNRLIGQERMLILGRELMEGLSQNLNLVLIGFMGIILLSFYISYGISKKIYMHKRIGL